MSKSPCIECGVRPKWGGRHRCVTCATRHAPIDEQVSQAAYRLGFIPDELRLKRVPEYLWPAGQRWCASCQSFVDLADVQGSRCRACASAAAHSARIEKVYGLDQDGYKGLLALQGGKCAICRNRPKSKRLAVDHDHKTGAVRGLLCSRCNHDLMGAAWDSMAMAEALLGYLTAPPATGQWQSPEAPRTESPRAEATLGALGLMAPGGRPVPPRGSEGLDRRTAAPSLVADQVAQLVAVGGESVPGKRGVWRVFVEPGGDPPF